jgi:hypothetical protein
LSDTLHTPTDRIIILFISAFEAVAYPAYAKAIHNTGRPQRTRIQGEYKLSEDFAKKIFTNTEQKYMMLLPFERGTFAVS